MYVCIHVSIYSTYIYIFICMYTFPCFYRKQFLFSKVMFRKKNINNNNKNKLNKWSSEILKLSIS